MNDNKLDLWLERILLVVAPIVFALASIYLLVAFQEVPLAIACIVLALAIRIYARSQRGTHHHGAHRPAR